MTKIWEGANAKNADLDVKVGPYFTLPVFRAAPFLDINFMFNLVAHKARKFLPLF